jgi:hypothetical protein
MYHCGQGDHNALEDEANERVSAIQKCMIVYHALFFGSDLSGCRYRHAVKSRRGADAKNVASLSGISGGVDCSEEADK